MALHPLRKCSKAALLFGVSGIEQDQLELLPGQALQGIYAVPGPDGGVTGILQLQPQDQGNIGFIIDNEDSFVRHVLARQVFDHSPLPAELI